MLVAKCGALTVSVTSRSLVKIAPSSIVRPGSADSGPRVTSTGAVATLVFPAASVTRRRAVTRVGPRRQRELRDRHRDREHGHAALSGARLFDRLGPPGPRALRLRRGGVRAARRPRPRAGPCGRGPALRGPYRRAGRRAGGRRARDGRGRRPRAGGLGPRA